MSTDNLPTPEQLEEWRALCEQATPGPWRMVEDSAEERTVRASGRIVSGVVATVRVKWVHEVQRAEQVVNAQFIATARTALPALLAERRALKEEIQGLRYVDAELSRVSQAIGSVEFMDPPDGGSVTLSEQVARMRAELDRLRAVLVPCETCDALISPTDDPEDRYCLLCRTDHSQCASHDSSPL